MKQKTREELIAENSEFRSANVKWAEADDGRRLEFSKILNAPLEKKGAYDYNYQPTVYSWSQIFAEVGKLLTREDNLLLREKVEKLSFAVDQIQLALIDDEPHDHEHREH